MAMSTPYEFIELDLHIGKFEFVEALVTAGVKRFDESTEKIKGFSEDQRLYAMATFVAIEAAGLDLPLKQMLLNNSRLSSMMAELLNLDSLDVRDLRIMVDLMPFPPVKGAGSLSKEECIAYLKQKL